MSRDLLSQLNAYGGYCDERQGSVAVEEIVRTEAPNASGSTVRFVATGDEPDGWEEREHLDDLTVEYLVPRDEPTAHSKQKRWIGALAAAATAVLVVVGVVVAADRNFDLETDPTSSSAEPDPGLLPNVADPVLGYRWHRVERGPGSVAVITGGPGFVAAGTVQSGENSMAAVWTSVDGIAWSRAPHDEAIFGDSTEISSLAAGGPGLVAVGAAACSDVDCDAAIWTSVDGIAWSRVAHDEAIFGGGWIVSVAAGGPGLVAVGGMNSDDDSDAAIWTSVDGVVWSRVPHDEAIFGGGVSMSSVIAGGPGLVAVGGSGPHENGAGAVWTSVDGTSWSRAPHDEEVFGGGGEQWITSVTAAGPGLVAVGWDQSGFDADASVWTSPDGITWSRAPHDEEVFGGPSYQAMWGVTAGGPGVVAVGSSRSSLADDQYATVWSSLDGITWSRVFDPEAVLGVGDMNSVTARGSGLVAVGDTVWVAVLEK